MLENCNVLLCPSLWEEPFGRVALDAFKNGLPVISSNIGAFPEIVIDGYNGLLIDPFNSNDISLAMKKIMEDKEYYKNLLKNIPDSLKKFDIKVQVDSFVEIYKKIESRWFNGDGKRFYK